jgi:serine/threonine protein kinase
MHTRSALQKIGDYEVVEKIAEGGMGTVYKAREPDTKTIVAVKVLPPHLAKNQILLRRFEKEYNVARSLDHPNIVRALDFGDFGSSKYLVMEFVEGESLGDRLEREKRLPEGEAIRLISQIAQGLSKAHKSGLVHRDVKPDNILITPDGQAKLTDLGLVKELETTDLSLTRTGRGLGTPHFMAPEQFRNAKNADARCDIYSLAATLYMMVTGDLPFKALGPLEAWMKKAENKLKPARELVPELSERVDWAIRRAMHSDPDHRPASCHEFLEDLTGHSTKKIAGRAAVDTQEDMWYLRFRDSEGVVHNIRSSLSSIRRQLKEGLLEDAGSPRASRDKDGPFEPLRLIPEFRDLVLGPVTAAPPPRLKPASRNGMPVASRNPTPRPAPRPVLQRETPTPSVAVDPVPPPSVKLPSTKSAAVKVPPVKAPGTPAAAERRQFDMPQIKLQGDQPRATDWRTTILLLVLTLLAGIGGFLALTLVSR